MANLPANYKLSLVALLELFGFSMIIVVFFPYVRALGGSQLYLGSILSVTSLIGLIWNPIIGSLGDTYGRKFILIRMTAMAAVINSLLLLSDSLLLIFIARTLIAFCGPLPPILGTAASELSEAERSSYYNKLPAVMSLGFVFGSLTGGFLSELSNGTTITFMVLVLSNLIGVVMVSTLEDVKQEKETREEPLPILEVAKQEMKKIWIKLVNVDWQKYSDIFSVKFCFEFGCGIFLRSFGPQMMAMGLRGRSMGYLFTFISMFTIIDNIVLVKLKNSLYAADSLGRKRLFHASVIFVIASILFTIADNVYILTAGLFTMTAARTIADSTFTEALMARATEKDKGSVSGAFESITSFVGLITPIGAGILTDLYGQTFTTSLSIAPLMFSTFLTIRRI